MKLFYSFIIILLFNFTNAQQYKLTGKIIDFHNGEPIENAKIEIEINHKKVYFFSDEKGFFIINNIIPNVYLIKVSHENCSNLIKEIDVNQDKQIELLLEHHSKELAQVNAFFHKNENLEKSVSNNIKNYILNTNLSSVLENIASVRSLSTGTNVFKPYIDGVYGSKISIINNGIKQEDAQWGDEHAPALSVSNFSKISVFKGASTLQFSSDAIGGVIFIDKASKSLKDSLIGSLSTSYSTNSKAYSSAFNIHKGFKNNWNLIFDFDFLKAGDSSAPDYILSNTAQNKQAFSSTIFKKNINNGITFYYSYFNNEIGFLRSSHVNSIRDLSNAIESEKPWFINDFTYKINPPNQTIKHNLASVSYYKRFFNLGKLDISYSYQNNQRKEFDIRRAGRSDLPVLNLTLNANKLTTDFIFDSKENRKIKVGIFGSYQHNHSDLKSGVRPLIPSYEEIYFGGYTFLYKKLNNKWDAEMSSRFDYLKYNAQKEYSLSVWNEKNYDNDFSDFIETKDIQNNRVFANPKLDFYKFSKAFQFSNILNDKTTFVYNLSFLMRSPNVSELFSEGVHHASAQYLLGDLRLKNEKNIKFLFSYKQKINFLNGFNWDFQTFSTYTFDYIYRVPTQIITNFPTYEFKQTKAFMLGFDADFNLKINDKIKLQSQTSYLFGKNVSESNYLPLIPPFKTVESIEYENKKWNNFFIKLKYEFQAKQNNFPVYNHIISYLENNQLVIKNIDLSTPPNLFSLIHINSGIKYKINKKDLLLGIYIHNLLNKSYRNYTNLLRYYSDETGRNISLQIKYNF